MKYEQLHSKIVILNLIVIGVISLEKTTLTLQEVLRHSNHDLLNDLHLIRMNLDLDRVDEAKKIIDDIAESCKSYSMTNKLGLTKTALWIQVFKWRYPAIMLQLHCDIESPVGQIWDGTIEQYLEKTIIHVYEVLDPYTEHQLTLSIETDDKGWSITFHLSGKWQMMPISIENTIFEVKTSEQTDTTWKYVVHHYEE